MISMFSFILNSVSARSLKLNATNVWVVIAYLYVLCKASSVAAATTVLST